MLAPFSTEIVMQVLLGYWLFGDIPNRWAIAGITLIIGVGIYLSSASVRDKPPDKNPAGSLKVLLKARKDKDQTPRQGHN